MMIHHCNLALLLTESTTTAALVTIIGIDINHNDRKIYLGMGTKIQALCCRSEVIGKYCKMMLLFEYIADLTEAFMHVYRIINQCLILMMKIVCVSYDDGSSVTFPEN